MIRDFLDRGVESYLESSRRFRTHLFGFFVPSLKRLGISAHLLTLLSFVSGAASVLFFFERLGFFFGFAILHFLFDALDGVVARAEGPTRIGAYFDTLSDNIVALLLLFRISFSLGSTLGFFVAILYFIHFLFYLFSSLRVPFLAQRTLVFLFSFFGLYTPLFFSSSLITCLGFIIQFRYFLRRKS